jgi:hypothetical protein
MDIVGSIIHNLNKEEIRFFKLYNSRMESGERKDILLFDYIRKAGKNYDEDKIFQTYIPVAIKMHFTDFETD